jgi:hypothetical protein
MREAGEGRRRVGGYLVVQAVATPVMWLMVPAAHGVTRRARSAIG